MVYAATASRSAASFNNVSAPCALISARNARCAMGALLAFAFQSTIAVRSF